MPRHPIIILSLALALAMAPAPAALAQSKPPAPDIEVLYIPHDALPNAPGYSPEGVFLPLSQLLTLAREAGRAGGAKPLPDAVRCPSIELSGVLDVGLTLDGRIVFEAPRAEWSATLINDGGMPWASQSVSSGTLAFLARAEGKTYLYAKGPAKGAVTVRAAIAPPFSGANAVLSLGRFYAPCRVDIGLAAGVQFTSATAPATVQSQGVDTAKLNLAKMWISVWPSQDEEARVYLQRRIPWQAPAALRAKLNRTAIAAGGDGLEIQDELLLEDRFAPGSPVRLAFPEELRLLEASAEGAARLDVTSSGAVLMPLKEGSALSVRARFMAYARGGSVVLAPWGIQSAAGAPPAAQSASLTLRPSERDAPFLKTRPAGLFPAGGDGRERRYDFWGAPPAMEVALARSTAPQPPQAESQLAIVRNEATLRTQLRFKDANREDLAFAVPAEWILADLKAASGSQAAPFSLQEQEAGQWRVSWDPAQPPDLIELTLHRSGAWGAPGTSATLEVPFLRVGQPQPLRHEMTVTWPEEMDAQAVRLSSVEVAAAAQAQAQAQVFAANAPAQQSARSAAPAAIERRSGAANLALRATGERPKGALDIRGRETDAQAVVATSLQIAEDRVTVRAAILYTVRFAPANTFRFTLPAGTGRNVRISGLGVRETTMNPTPEGDEWTVAMRQGVLGAFELEMEWSPSANPAAQAVAAPKIIAQAVSSQRGFLVVEGSETLRLSMKTENLSEADLSELPPVFWTRAGKLGRVLAVWRYVNPPYALTVTAEKFKTEPPLRGLAREAKIVTTLSPSGERFTRAAYSIAPTSDRQFFEARLPEGAQLWAALVNGKGVMPARRREGASQWILAPLPAASASASDCGVTLIYRELGMPLDTLRRLEVKSPELPIPINRTSWDLNLPPGYEYLGFRGDSGKLSVVSDPAARFFRTAYYPSRLVFMEMPLILILVLTAVVAGVLFFIFFFIRHSKVESSSYTGFDNVKKNDKEEATDTAPPDRPKSPELPPPFPRYNLGPLPKLPPETKSGCTSRLFGILIVLGVILILFMIAVPNFLESQSRSKVSRAMADQRSLATGLEAYYVDYNSYPAWVEVLWQGPVKYLSQGPVDPFAGRGSLSSGDGQSLFHYVTGTDAFNRAKQAGLVNPYAEQPSSFWMTYSVGPSGQDSGGTIVYDPTNGTISAGNIIRISQGNLSGYGDSFSRLSYGGAYGGAAPAAKSASVSRAKMPAGESGSGYSMKATFPALGRQGAPEPPQGASAAGEAKTQDRLAFAYDPTNGTASEGDIYRTKDSVDYQTGRRLADGELLKSGRTAGPGKPETVVGSAGALFSEGYANAVLLNLSGENSFKDLEAIRRKEAAARQAGLLSMGIELPEGGTRKKLETLGEAKRIEIRLMDWKDYARLQFLVWIAAFLLLTWIWIARRAWFRSAFIAAIALSLLPPVLFDTPWAPLFNAAFQGVLLSLASPIIHFLIHRYGWFAPHAGNHGGDSQSGNSAASPSGRSPEGPGARGGAKAVIFIAAALSLGAPSTASTASTLSTPSTPSTNPVRILVPYDATELKLITLQETPSFLKRDLPAFLSRADFTRLWNAARRDQTEPARLQPLIAEMRLTGTLSPERSTIEGELTLLAINPANAPSSAVIGLEGMALTESTASAPGAALEEGAKTGLLLQMSANWSGAIVARFVLPCQTRGATGRMSLRFPDAGAGTWKIQIPYPDVTAKYGEAARAAAQTLCVSERTSGSTILTGAIKPGPFNLSWTARETGGGGAASARAGANEWRAVITQRVSWEDLSEARFFATISLSPSAAGKNLPAEVTLAHDSSLSVVSAKGEGLLSAEDAPADEPAGGPGARATSRLVLRLADVPSASIVLEGICRAPSGGRPWQALGVRAPQGIESRATLRLEIPDDIEIQSVQTRGLERRPTREAIPGCSVFIYESARGDGEATLALRRLEAAFDVETLDAFAPAGDLLWRAATIQLTPRSSQLRECVLEAPAGLRVLTLKGKDVAGWFQSGDRIFAAFHPPLEHPSALELTAIGETRASSDVLTLRPLAVQGASRTRGGAVIVVPAGAECGEIDIAKATPRPPTNVDGLLAAQACGVESAKSGSLRAYTLDSTAPLRLAFRTLEATSLDTVFNRLTVSDGLQSLECVVRSEPRRGRLNRIEALLVLPAPDPTAPARLQVSGPVRHLKTDPVGARAWRVTAELNAPYAHAVEVRFQLDRPLPPEEKSLVRSMAFLPVRGGGARAFLLLRRAFEGELKTAEAAGARSLDPSTPPWPGADFHPMPSDQAFELSTAANAIPTFAVTRHARSEALRAVAEALRQRVIVTDDGLERVELTIVLQNQSEQFLKIALPYPKERITIYETRVADRLVKTTFGMEAGREALLVPLIRPGALDPELTIRIAFTAKSGKPLHGSGAREERQAEVLGGVPVAHSSLVLMLPPDFQYSKFEGTLNRVEMVDLEIDEALRGAKKIERLTQIALYNPALVQHKTLQQLNAYQAGIEMNVKAARQINEAQKRMYRARETAQDQKESQREQELDKARAQTLEEAESAAKTSMFSNTRINQAFIAQNAQQPGAPAQPPSAAAVEPPPPAQPAVMAPIEFPRVGEVFVFRQLQGTGAVTFRYHSREAAGFRNDVFFALFLTLMAAIATYASRHLFANLRRAAILALILCITAILFRVALDVTIPAAALALLLLLLRRKRPAASK